MFLTAQQAGANPVLNLNAPRGMSGYRNVGGDWSWEFYPPPYDFLAPKNSVPMPAPVILPGGGLAGYRRAGMQQGLGCPGNPNCGCGPSACGKGGLAGIEDMVGNLASGNFGDALLGYDLSGSIPNWLVVIGVVWAYTAITNQASGFGSRVKKRYRKSMKAKGH